MVEISRVKKSFVQNGGVYISECAIPLQSMEWGMSIIGGSTIFPSMYNILPSKLL